MSANAYFAEQRPQYIIFDKQTGQIVHVHSRFSVPENKYVEIPIEELKGTLAKDDSIVKRLSGGDAANLDVIAESSADARSSTRFKVDVQARKIVAKPSLSLKAEKSEVSGDGKDSTSVEIQAVGEDGKTDLGFDDNLKVTTTRGKLSTRGGIVEMRQGKAQITLTSVKETVQHVQIVATSVNSSAAPGSVSVEFV
jgi:hypothetical protein